MKSSLPTPDLAPRGDLPPALPTGGRGPGGPSPSQPVDRYRIDSHKLMYHPDRVAAWLAARGDWEKAKHIYPIYVEVSPMGSCNHRCSFCAVDYIGYQTRRIEAVVLRRVVEDMAVHGVRSIMFAGEGEPLLHKEIGEVIVHARASGIDTAITTNGVPLGERLIEQILPHTSWIKVSINAGTPTTYAKVHGTRPEDFNRVFSNLSRAVAFRRAEKASCALGAQIVLLPENQAEVLELARRCKDTGLDYLVVKPYSQHPMSHETRKKGYERFRYDTLSGLEEDLLALQDEAFDVVFRRRTMSKLEESDRYYQSCSATPFFWAYIMAGGDVYACSAYLQDPRFRCGNVREQSFSEIWEGEMRRRCHEFVRRELNIAECRKNCRMDEVNRYFWDLIHPPAHVNFV